MLRSKGNERKFIEKAIGGGAEPHTNVPNGTGPETGGQAGMEGTGRVGETRIETLDIEIGTVRIGEGAESTTVTETGRDGVIARRSHHIETGPG